MKDIKMKSSHNDANVGIGSLQKNIQATEEQMRYAKLAQSNTKEEQKIQEKMKEVAEITRKPSDIVSIALHDCDYDTSQAIQNIFEGRYDDQGGWKTTATRKGKKPIPTADVSTHHTSESAETFNNTDNPEDQRPTIKPSRLFQGGNGGNIRGRSGTRNWRDKIPNEEKFEQLHIKENSRDRSDRGRGRGRGHRGGGAPRAGRGGRGGFSRIGFGRGPSCQQGRGFNRAIFTKTEENRKEENEESWDLDAANVNDKSEDWADDVIDDTNVNSPDWSKDDWSKQTEQVDVSLNNPTDSLFAHDSSVTWSHVNGKEPDSWKENNSTDEKGKYLPENVDAAVIRSIPTSSTSGEVTAYQPTNDISRYLNNASNQFPSSHQEGGLTSSITDRAFSLPKPVTVSDSNKRTLMPIISGVTESHKLEQEQLRIPKTQRVHKPRKSLNKYIQFPSQPVVMPRSAQMVNDIEEQFTGLEFGSGPLSPRFKSEEQPTTAVSSTSTNPRINMNTMSMESSSRHAVATLSSQALISETSQGLSSQAVLLSSPRSSLDTVLIPSPMFAKNDMPKTPPGFKPLDQQNSSPHYLSSPGSGLMAPDPIPFPSSTNRTSPTSSTLNVFSRNGGLGTSVTVTEQQQLSLSNFNDQQVYDKHDQNINAQKIIAEQKALADKQYLAERERIIADQRAFAEQKSLAQKRLQEDNARSDRLSVDLSDQRLGLTESPLTESAKLASTDPNYLSNKIQKSGVLMTLPPPPPGVMPPSSYSSTPVLSNEMLGLTSATGVQTTAKMQGSSSANKSSGLPGVLPLNLAQYSGVQPVMPAYQHQQMHGYSYDELLQMQRMPVSPYHYDLSMFQAAGTASTTRDGIQTYQGSEPKFPRGSTDESSPVNMPQGNQHVAATNLPTHQAAYLNATGQLPYGYTYAYQPGVLPQAGVYPTYTAPSVYQVTQATKGVGATQYQSQYQAPTQQQVGYNSSKYSGSAAHDYQKPNYLSSGTVPPTLGPHGKSSQQHIVTSNAIPSSAQAIHQSAFKSQYHQDAKTYLGNSSSSLNSVHLHNQQATHMQGNINPYLLQQHTSMMTHGGQVSAAHLGHHQQQQQPHQQQIDAVTHRNQVHGFSANQSKRDIKGNYQSYWSGTR